MGSIMRTMGGRLASDVCTRKAKENNNNNNEDNVYGATVRVNPVRIVNMEQHQAATSPEPRPNNPGCESICIVGCQKPHPPLPLTVLWL